MLNRFIPSNYRGDKGSLNQARFLLILTLINLFFWLTWTITTLVVWSIPQGEFSYQFLEFCILAIQLYAIYRFIRHGNYQFAAWTCLLVNFVTYLWVAMMMGSHGGPSTLTTFFAITLVAFVLLDMKSAIWVAIVCCSFHIAYTLLPTMGVYWAPLFRKVDDSDLMAVFLTVMLVLNYIVIVAVSSTFKLLNQHLTQQLIFDNELLALASNQDDLTKIGNRRFFNERIEYTLDKAQSAGRAFSLLYIDLDGFKQINDQYGHSTGDEIIKAVVKRMKTAFRDDDLITRIGGDEFAVILHGANITIAENLSKKLVGMIKEPIVIAGDKLAVGASIGVAQYPVSGQTAKALIESADRAMYDAKAKGGGVLLASNG